MPSHTVPNVWTTRSAGNMAAATSATPNRASLESHEVGSGTEERPSPDGQRRWRLARPRPPTAPSPTTPPALVRGAPAWRQRRCRWTSARPGARSRQRALPCGRPDSTGRERQGSAARRRGRLSRCGRPRAAPQFPCDPPEGPTGATARAEPGCPVFPCQGTEGPPMMHEAKGPDSGVRRRAGARKPDANGCRRRPQGRKTTLMACEVVRSMAAPIASR